MRIGGGELGGKARGLADIRRALHAAFGGPPPGGIRVDIPAMVVLGTHVFDSFMQHNRLYDVALADGSDERIARAFHKAELPFSVLGDLRALANQVHVPLAVRSSSLLEDAEQQPFAGIYATKMIPNNQYDADARFNKLVEAIKFVYASTFSASAKAYRRATGHDDEEEKMAVIIQELVGKRHQPRFYPELSGVARSLNYYPMGPAQPEEGVVSLALGLGKTIVDGGVCWSYSPGHPKVDPPFASVEELVHGTQTEFWAVNMGEAPAYEPLKETEYLVLENFTLAERDGALRYLASTYSPLSGRLYIGTVFDGPRVLTFAPLLVLEEIPFNSMVGDILQCCQAELGKPVEIEFAMTFEPHRFAFLQVRPMATSQDETLVGEEDMRGENVLVATETALGNGALDTIYDVVYTIPESFSLQHTRAVIPDLERINRGLLEAGRDALLIVLGRLGTTDPWLGIPINWAKISAAKAVVEATRQNVRVELSQGSHYFHNIVSLGVKYFNLPISSPHGIDWEWLAGQEAVEETPLLRHVRLSRPLLIKVDGRSRRGVIYKQAKTDEP
jgi:hypothetical protein